MDDSSQLCEKCSGLKLHESFPTGPHICATFTPDETGWFGNLSTNCTLCTLIKKSLSLDKLPDTKDEDGKPHWEISMTSNIFCYASNQPLKNDNFQLKQSYECCRILLGLINRHEYNDMASREVTIQLSDRNCSELPFGRLMHGRLVNETRTDFGLPRTWLNLCSDSHGDACQPGPFDKEFPNPRRLIDCHNRCIIQNPRGCQYVALSYVWGETGRFGLTQDNEASMERVGALSDDDGAIPLVIRDAILATIELNLRYLWVDCICILQDNDSDLRTQIGKMDLIYSHAALTIVDASGNNAEAGLSGVRVRHQFVPQYTATCQGLHLVVSQELKPCSYELEGPLSAWDLRGWTFQEKSLSKRLLYFTPSQALFKCQCATYCEDTILETPDQSIKIEMFRDITTAARFAKSPWEKFIRFVEEYTGRVFTYEGDILDAFEGVMNLLKPDVGDFFWGHPVQYFGQSLLWRRKGYFSKRASGSFPSWSWAAWKTPDDYELESAVWSLLIPLETKSVFSIRWATIRPSDGEFIHLYATAGFSTGLDTKETNEMTLDPEDIFFKAHGFRDSKWLNPNTIPDLEAPLTHIICFETSLARLSVKFVDPESLTFPTLGCVTGRGGEILTTVFLPVGFEVNDGNKYDFIAVYRIRRSPGDFLLGAGFLVMMIEWHKGVAFRVGLSNDSIEVQDWYRQKPERRIVNLG